MRTALLLVVHVGWIYRHLSVLLHVCKAFRLLCIVISRDYHLFPAKHYVQADVAGEGCDHAAFRVVLGVDLSLRRASLFRALHSRKA